MPRFEIPKRARDDSSDTGIECLSGVRHRHNATLRSSDESGQEDQFEIAGSSVK